jgi:SAM-dependent methyltransferase
MASTPGTIRVAEERPTTRVCAVCHGWNVEPLFERDGYAFYQCANCDVVSYSGVEMLTRTEPLFPAEYFTEGGSGYPGYIADERAHRKQARIYLRRLAAHGVSMGRGDALFEVGCAAGFFLDEARMRGWRVAGCDVSATMVAHARERLGLDVVHGEFLDTPLAAGATSVVAMFSVLEHLPAPLQVEERVYDMLRPGGHLVIETWNRRAALPHLMGPSWHVYAPPETLFYHSKRSLRALFGADRWDLVGMRPAVKWISVRHGLAALERVSATAVGVARRVLGQGSTDLAVPYVFGDLVFSVFRKRATA